MNHINAIAEAVREQAYKFTCYRCMDNLPVTWRENYLSEILKLGAFTHTIRREGKAEIVLCDANILRISLTDLQPLIDSVLSVEDKEMVNR